MSATTKANALASFFHCGEKQNSSHYHTYCKGCVEHHKTISTMVERTNDKGNMTMELTDNARSFEDGEYQCR